MSTPHRRHRRTVRLPLMLPRRRTVRRLLGGIIRHTLMAARLFIGLASSELLRVKYFDKQNAYEEEFRPVASGSGGNVLGFRNICARAVSDHG
jgi:hypothetical protein